MPFSPESFRGRPRLGLPFKALVRRFVSGNGCRTVLFWQINLAGAQPHDPAR
jgi:hypothetical protein